MHHLVSILHFLIDTVFTTLISLLLLRLLLQWVRADFNSPLGELVIKFTNPLLIPIRRFVPGLLGVDWATILLIFLAALINQFLLVLLSGLALKSVLGVLFLAIAEILKLTYYIYFLSAIAIVVMDLFSHGQPNPMLKPLSQLLSKPLALIRQYVKPFKGYDLSFFVFILVLIVLNMGVVHPIRAMAVAMLTKIN